MKGILMFRYSGEERDFVKRFEKRARTSNRDALDVSRRRGA